MSDDSVSKCLNPKWVCALVPPNTTTMDKNERILFNILYTYKFIHWVFVCFVLFSLIQFLLVLLCYIQRCFASISIRMQIFVFSIELSWPKRQLIKPKCDWVPRWEKTTLISTHRPTEKKTIFKQENCIKTTKTIIYSQISQVVHFWKISSIYIK